MKLNHKQIKINGGFTRTPKFGVTPKGGGFTLVETLIALLIFTLSILSLMSVLGSGLSNTGYAKQKIAAGYLAQEGIECVRNMRDNSVLYNVSGAEAGWNEFKNSLSNVPEEGICPIDPTDADFVGFRRDISADIDSFGADEIKILSTVTWTQGSGDYSITFSENLFNWVE